MQPSSCPENPSHSPSELVYSRRIPQPTDLTAAGRALLPPISRPGTRGSPASGAKAISSPECLDEPAPHSLTSALFSWRGDPLHSATHSRSLESPTRSSPASPTKAHVTEPGSSLSHQPGPVFHFLPSHLSALSVAQLTHDHAPDSNPRSYFKVQIRLLPPFSEVFQRLPTP